MAFGVVTQQSSWYLPDPKYTPPSPGVTTTTAAPSWGLDARPTMQETATFLSSTFQYVWMAFVFSKGLPYRKPFYYNWVMVALGLIQISVCMWISLDNSNMVADLLNLVPLKNTFYRICSVGVAFLNLLIYIFIEKFIIEWLFLNKMNERRQVGLVTAWLSGRPRQSPMHERIVRLIGDSPNWLTSNQTKI